MIHTLLPGLFAPMPALMVLWLVAGVLILVYVSRA